MKVYFHLVRIVPFFLFSVYCGDSPVAPPASSTGKLMPMEVGNYWLYQAWRPAIPETLKAEITRKVPVTINGVMYEASAYLLPYAANGPRPPFEWLYWNGPAGLYWMGGIAETDTLLYKTLLFKYPAEVSDSWTAVRINYDPILGKFCFFDTLKVGLVSKNEKIETPAGKFECYVYKYSKRSALDVYDNWDYYHYYVPETGRVAYIQINSITERPLDRMYLMKHSKVNWARPFFHYLLLSRYLIPELSDSVFRK